MAWRDLFRWGQKSASAYDILRELAARYRSRSGKAVNTTTALEVSTAFGCGRVLGQGMATPPFKLMRETDNGKRRTRMPARDHPAYNVLARKTNPWQTSYEFREMLSWHVEFCGRGISFINRSAAGDLLELIPFEPNAVTVKRADNGTLSYDVRSQNGSTQTFPEAAIWHLRGPSWNGWDGMEIIKIAREALGLAMVIEESQASTHKNGVRSSGTYSVEGKLSPTDYKDLRDWIAREQVGPNKDGTPFILDRAAKWMATQMTGVDAQTLETRRFQIEEVCRFFGVMPIMVGYSDKASTYASSEQMFLAHMVHTLSPRWTRFEQSADAYLLSEKDRDAGLYFDFVEEGMIRGSVKDTKDALLGYLNGGAITANETRDKLDLNPDDDPESDKLRIPVNTVQAPDPNADDKPDPAAGL